MKDRILLGYAIGWKLSDGTRVTEKRENGFFPYVSPNRHWGTTRGVFDREYAANRVRNFLPHEKNKDATLFATRATAERVCFPFWGKDSIRIVPRYARSK